MKIILTISLSLLCGGIFAQNVGINVDGAAPHPSALLDINASGLASNNKKGLLIPEMTTAERDAMPTDTIGLLIFNTDDTCFNYYTGVVWLELCGDTVDTTSTDCPPGFLRVPNQNFCIETDERTPLTWFQANILCQSMGAKLCTWDDWHYACDQVSATFPLQNMTTNGYEWTRSSGDGTQVRVMGSVSCTDIANDLPSLNPMFVQDFRCCCCGGSY